ncbi:ABC transporter permease [Psittacicella gerlachiana]|uniref:Oligopeptide transport system permease protein OppC n=1 Tax=Psittacicella gerlachiana TaxID=2028574 RepID=A0A3A1YFX1_9GAMM|nr:ABC transporter permease subunit [Psittacicella gerlachiana]RIY35124.1 peptide ABC transporter permease [Psittacicella gerlachiana]
MSTKTLNPNAEEPKANELEIDSRSYWQDAAIRFMRNKAAVASTIVLLAILLFVIFAPFFIHWNYEDIDWDNISTGPSSLHLLGTDENGRDVLARIAYGGRISFTIGFLTAIFSIIIGVTYGAVSGYFGGLVDSLMMRTLEVLDSLPGLFVIIMALVFFGNSLVTLIGLMSITGWYGKARMIRSLTIAVKNREYIDAARVIGVSNPKIVLKHIVPNLMSTIVIYLSFSIPGAIAGESALSYLGLGVQEPLASWGSLIADGSSVMQVAPWLLFFPSLFLSTTIFCFTFIGDGLRDALDPKDR